MLKTLWMCGAAAVAVATFADSSAQAADPAAAAPAASGSTQFGDVTVTARRREENVQRVPLSVQALSANALQEKGITQITDLKQVVPGLNIIPGTFRESTPAVSIRGFPVTGLQIDNDPSIPFIINEIPINTPQGQNASFFDLQSVQVLKGPQGTLQGRNTVAGAVLITTRKPDLGVFGGYLQASVGNYNAYTLEGALNIPIGDTFALRIDGRRDYRKGTWVNQADGRDYDDHNNWATRVSARWRPTGQIEDNFVFDLLKSDTHGTAIVFQDKGFDAFDPTHRGGGQFIPCASSIPAVCGAHNISIMLAPGFSAALSADAAHQASLGWGHFDSYLTAANSRLHVAPFEHILNWGVSNNTAVQVGGATLKNIFGYRHLSSLLYEDIDGTSRGMSNVAGLGNAPFPLLDTYNPVEFDQFTDEVNASGTALEGRVNWIGGAFFSQYTGFDASDAMQFGRHFFGSIFHTKATSYAVYGQVDTNLTDKFTLTTGFRYTWDRRHGHFNNIQNIPVSGPGAGGYLGYYGTTIVLPTITDPFGKITGKPQCNINVQATSTHAAFAGVNPADCSLDADLNGSSPSYNITLQYRPAAGVMIYLAHRQGYRAGFVSARATSYENMFSQPETVRDLELGLKSQSVIGGVPVRFNAAGYYSWYTNIAVSVPKIDPASGLPVNESENSGKARLYGGEFSLDVKPTSTLTVSVSYAYTYAVYDSYPSQTITDALGAPLVFYSNAALQFGYPRHSLVLAADWMLPIDASVGTLNLSGNFSYLSAQPDLKGFYTIPARGILNLRLDWRNFLGRGLDVALWANNVTDVHYLNGIFSFEDAAGFRSGFPGDPRTFGATVTYRFGGEHR